MGVAVAVSVALLALFAIPIMEIWSMMGHMRLKAPGKSTTEMMHACVYDRHGDVSVLEMRSIPRPAVGPGLVMVKVAGAALNPVDFKMRRNSQPDLLIPKPKIPGYDVSGTVVAAGDGSGFKVGDNVFAMLPILGQAWGALSEYAAADSRIWALAPSGAQLPEVAALPLVGLTVLQVMDPAIAELGETKGKRILVQAAAGGVGSFAVQYAKNVLGMHVTGTCSKNNVDFCRSLGVDEVIDYKSVRFEDVVQNMDIVLDPMAWAYQERTLNSSVLRPGGHYCHVLSSDWKVNDAEKSPALPFEGPAKKWLSLFRRLIKPDAYRFHSSAVQPDGEGLRRIAAWVDEGKIKPVIDEIFTLDRAADAMQLLEEGHVRGKLIVKP